MALNYECYEHEPSAQKAKRRLSLRIHLSLCFSIFIVMIISSHATGEWSLYKRASIKSKEGHSLRIDSSGNKDLMIWFMLKKKTLGAFSEKMPVYRVDELPVRSLDNISGLKVKKKRWIRWLISKGKSPSKELVEVMHGKEMIFQYYRDDGRIMEAIFSLEGAKEAVSEIMGSWE